MQNASQAPLKARAKLSGERDNWTLDIALGQGQRRVTGDSCVSVAEALVVILALAVNPTAKLNVATFPELENQAHETPGDANAQSSAALPRVDENAPSRVHYPRAAPKSAEFESDDSVPNQQEGPARFGLSLLTLADTGTLPSWSLGPSLFARYGKRSYWGELSLDWLMPRWAPLTQGSAKGGNVSWFAGQFAACWMTQARLRLGGCLGAEMGDLVGKGDGVAYSKTALALWLAAAVNAVARVELRRDFAFEARLGLAVPALRPEFGLEGYGGFFRPDMVSLRAALGFSWH